MIAALQDFSTATPVAPIYPSFAPLQSVQTQAAATQQAPRPAAQRMLNGVSVAELQPHVVGDFAQADDWFTLCRSLRRKGLCLKMRGEDLWVYDAASHAPITSCEDLGIDTDELELRFGPSQPQRTAAEAA